MKFYLQYLDWPKPYACTLHLKMWMMQTKMKMKKMDEMKKTAKINKLGFKQMYYICMFFEYSLMFMPIQGSSIYGTNIHTCMIVLNHVQVNGMKMELQ